MLSSSLLKTWTIIFEKHSPITNRSFYWRGGSLYNGTYSWKYSCKKFENRFIFNKVIVKIKCFWGTVCIHLVTLTSLIAYDVGVTQEMIDTLRLSRENMMLRDLQEAVRTGGDLECRARQGETPVRLHWMTRKIHSAVDCQKFGKK